MTTKAPCCETCESGPDTCTAPACPCHEEGCSECKSCLNEACPCNKPPRNPIAEALSNTPLMLEVARKAAEDQRKLMEETPREWEREAYDLMIDMGGQERAELLAFIRSVEDRAREEGYKEGSARAAEWLPERFAFVREEERARVREIVEGKKHGANCACGECPNADLEDLLRALSPDGQK